MHRLAILFALAGALAPEACAAAPSAAPSPRQAVLPAWFEAASGPQKAFVSKGLATPLAITATRIRMVDPNSGRHLDLRLEGANLSAALEGTSRLTGTTSDFRGRDAAHWRTGVPQFGSVTAKNVWPGIDAVYYSSERALEYDFLLAPGADPSQIRLRFDAQSGARLTPGGEIGFESFPGLTQKKPVAWQEKDGRRVEVACSYRMGPEGAASLKLGSYDRSLPLVIDPVIAVVSYFGGTQADSINSVAATPNGGYWLAGWTQSLMTIPEGIETIQPERKGDKDAFVAWLKPDENGALKLAYYSYLGGTLDDEATSIATDASGVVYLTGTTGSADFPLGGAAAQTANAGEIDAFVAKIDLSLPGTLALNYSSYYGGPKSDFARGVAGGPGGVIAITGQTTSGELPRMNETGFQPANRGGVDAFVSITNPSLSAADAVVLSSFLGGASSDLGYGCGFDKSGLLYLTGYTTSTDFPTAGAAYQLELAGAGDVYVVVVNNQKSGLEKLVYGTYLGGSALDAGTALLVDASARVWLTGYSLSPNFPVTMGAPQPSNAGSSDALLVRVNPAAAGSAFLEYSTYLGGSSAEVGYALALDANGQAVVAGYTMSPNFPVKGFPAPSVPPPTVTDAFVARFNPAASGADGLVWATPMGGSATDVATGVAVAANGGAFVGGYTLSPNLPVGGEVGKPNRVGFLTGFYFQVMQ